MDRGALTRGTTAAMRASLLLVLIAACGGNSDTIPPPAKPAAPPPAVTPPSPGPAAAGQLIEITVTDDGFVPSPIDVVACQQVTLVITRKTEKTCAREVVIKEH